MLYSMIEVSDGGQTTYSSASSFILMKLKTCSNRGMLGSYGFVDDLENLLYESWVDLAYHFSSNTPTAHEFGFRLLICLVISRRSQAMA